MLYYIIPQCYLLSLFKKYHDFFGDFIAGAEGVPIFLSHKMLGAKYRKKNEFDHPAPPAAGGGSERHLVAPENQQCSELIV